MAILGPVISAPRPVALATPVPDTASFDARWAEWQAKGAAQDRAFRRKVAVAAPFLIVIAAVVIYLLIGR